MKRLARLAASGAFAAAAIIPVVGVDAPATASAPPEVAAWFASLTLGQVMPYVQSFPSWSTEGTTDPKALSFGEPAPTLGYSLPEYDLSTNTMTGASTLNRALAPTGEYCARALVSERPIDVVACAAPAGDGSGYKITVVSEVHLLDASADLPSAGTTEPDHDFVGVVGSDVVPMDEAAQTWLGAVRIKGATFVELAAKQKAEWDAIDRINGPAMGGGIPLIGGDKAAVAAFEEAVSQGSGVPVSRLSHPDSVAGAEAPAAAARDSGAAGHESHRRVVVSSVAVVAAVMLLIGALSEFIRRRRGNRRTPLTR